MEFRLIYQGGLKAGSGREGRAEEKHRIRRQFHGQLKELWRDDPRLSVQLNPVLTKNEGDIPRSIVDLKASDYERCGYRFLPLIRKEDGFTCSLDILFLRRDIPGNLVRSGGDIDNRLKVLIDALRMPENCSELRGCSPAPDENPFFCLLEDDDLVTGITVTTDRLLRPRHEAEHIHDVCSGHPRKHENHRLPEHPYNKGLVDMKSGSLRSEGTPRPQ